MNQKITLYHGSEQLVETPAFGFGKKNNDFGLGFYCTESEELAKEWAVSSLRNGFANRVGSLGLPIYCVWPQSRTTPGRSKVPFDVHGHREDTMLRQ